MNNISVNLNDYPNKFVNLHNYTLIDVGHIKIKPCKFYIFFYYIQINLIAFTSYNVTCK